MFIYLPQLQQCEDEDQKNDNMAVLSMALLEIPLEAQTL